MRSAWPSHQSDERENQGWERSDGLKVTELGSGRAITHLSPFSPESWCCYSKALARGHFIFLLLFSFWMHRVAYGVSAPQTGIEPRPCQGTLQVLTTRLPGNSEGPFLTKPVCARTYKHTHVCVCIHIGVPPLPTYTKPLGWNLTWWCWGTRDTRGPVYRDLEFLRCGSQD